MQVFLAVSNLKRVRSIHARCNQAQNQNYQRSGEKRQDYKAEIYYFFSSELKRETLVSKWTRSIPTGLKKRKSLATFAASCLFNLGRVVRSLNHPLDSESAALNQLTTETAAA